MVTYLSDCINVVRKGAQNLPITTLVKSTYFHLAKSFVRKKEEGKGPTCHRTNVFTGLAMGNQGEQKVDKYHDGVWIYAIELVICGRKTRINRELESKKLQGEINESIV